jgi:hypothetical protein
MRFSTVSIVYLIGGALAAPLLSPRDDTVIKYNINRVGVALNSLESTLARRKPRPRDDRASVDAYFIAALAANDRVVSELRAGSQDIRRSRNKLSEYESATLSVSLMGQETTLQKIVNHWLDVKRDARDVNRDRDVLDGLQRAQDEQNHFSDSLIEKLNLINQALGKNAKSKISGHIEKGIKEYKRL